MFYPEYFTKEDIEEFEYEYSRYLELQDPHSLASINAECQAVAQQQQEDEFSLDSILV